MSSLRNPPWWQLLSCTKDVHVRSKMAALIRPSQKHRFFIKITISQYHDIDMLYRYWHRQKCFLDDITSSMCDKSLLTVVSLSIVPVICQTWILIGTVLSLKLPWTLPIQKYIHMLSTVYHFVINIQEKTSVTGHQRQFLDLSYV